VGRKGTQRELKGIAQELQGNFFAKFEAIRMIRKDLRGARELNGNLRELKEKTARESLGQG